MSAPEDCPWLEIDDPSTGRKFYANRETNERTWTMPEEYRLAHGLEKKVEPVWWELFDETNQLPYYHNVETSETLWVKPEGVEILTLAQQKADKEEVPQHDHKAKKKDRPTKNHKKSSERHKTKSLKKKDKKNKREGSSNDLSKSASFKKAKLKPGWIEVVDDSTGKSYYHNPESGETTWSKPVSKKKDEHDDTAADNDDNEPNEEDHEPNDEDNEEESESSTQDDVPKKRHSKKADAEKSSSMLDMMQSARDSAPKPPSINMAVMESARDEKRARSAANSSALNSANFGDLESARFTCEDGLARAYTRTAALPRAETVRSALPAGAREEALPTSIADELSRFQLEEFAKKFFDSHKKGVFRRQIPIKEMLLWSDHAPSTSLIKMTSSSRSKEGVALFKHVLAYMGDTPPAKHRTPMWHAIQAITTCINSPELRDEAFCQLCKQTNGNPNPVSAGKGWELFVMYAYSFAPTHDFEAWLRKYIDSAKSSGGTIALFASYTLRMLARTTRLSGSSLGKVPTKKELEIQREAPFNPSPFGATLDECMQLQQKRAPNAKLPILLTASCEHLLAKGRVEGIFRVASDVGATGRLRAALASDSAANDVVAAESDAHVVGAVLKQWVRELAEPLIAQSLYDVCIRSSENASVSLAVVERLEPLHRATLAYLCTFLREMAKHKDKTKMGIPNLAMVFAPNVLRCPSTNPQIIFENTKHEVNFMAHLVAGLKEQ